MESSREILKFSIVNFRFSILLMLLCLVASSSFADEAGFKAIFDGKTLAGWKAPDMSYWSVPRFRGDKLAPADAGDGAITAQSTQENPLCLNIIE